jgi:hypothetical protein
MTRNVRLSWIAHAEARRFEESVMIQHGFSEPTISVVPAEAAMPRRHWVRRLVAHLSPGSKMPSPPVVVWPGKGPR